MSPQRGGRFSYLAAGGGQPEAPAEQRPGQTGQDGPKERKTPERNGETGLERRQAARSGGEGSKKKTSTTHSRKVKSQKTLSDLRTVPKGEGRMKQDRSQLNVRIPTALKRRASAKAVLEGREIGEVVEELLQDYISK